ncbi:hypothetical protein M408DRAFT_332245 [Serendipita vermifera MAFF 305830]|uniref:Uncharacterized protein n=1 Tax=Serendipita vermifera MAFF 305830 TaxID=933852 RepID=A0A0C2X2I2_SERVB|nr:hypothetical protein M408DRAFT_332245 [Serendipita vermifera MAFF 305830]
MKRTAQKVLFVPNGRITANRCGLVPPVGKTIASNRSSSTTQRREFHVTSNRAQATDQDKQKPLHSKEADLNASSGTWGKQKADPASAPRGIGGLGPVGLTLGLIFMTCTAWLGYRYYRVTTVYPAPVRAQIRIGLKAMLDHDLEKAEEALRRAWSIAETLPPDSMGPEPLLKLSGISIQLAECLEKARKPKAAYEVYMHTLPYFFDQFDVYAPQTEQAAQRHSEWKDVPLSGQGRLRAVGIANRAAMLAQHLQGTGIEPPLCTTSTSELPSRWTRSWDEIELFLRTFAVTQVLYLTSHTTGIPTAALSTSPELDSRLPSWLRRLDLAAPCEALADCYVRRGEIELALPLYQTTYYFLLSKSSLPTASSISLTGPLWAASGPPPDSTTMCIAASVLTAMSAAALGVDSPKGILANKPSGSNAGVPDQSTVRSSRITAVRSWARESRYLVDLGRRSAGGKSYINSMAGIEVLGREREDADKAKGQKANPGGAKPNESSRHPRDADLELMEKDKRLVKMDLERIQEAGRRLGEIVLEGQLSSQNSQVFASKLAANPTCERTWAVVLYNTGIVEMMDDNKSIAEEYLQLALEQSRRTNLIEGVARSKVALMELMSKGGNSKA